MRLLRSKYAGGCVGLYSSPVGITLWRRGAISFIWRGMPRVQIVLGDWWKATEPACADTPYGKGNA